MIHDVGRLVDGFGERLHARTGRDSPVGELADRALLDDRVPWFVTPEARLPSGSRLGRRLARALDVALRDWKGQ